MTKLSDTEAMVELLSRKLEGHSIVTVAKATGMNKATVGRVYYREVKFPRSTTLFKLCAYFGLEIHVKETKNARLY